MESTSSTPSPTEPRVISGWKRVAWPELRILPPHISAASLPALMQQISQDILKNAHAIAKKHEILTPDDMGNQIHFQMRNGIPTLLVVALWSSEKTPIWGKAVQEMVMILAELSQSSSISEGDIHVEITAPEHEQTMYYAAPKDPSLSRTWDFVRPTVHDCLQSFQATRGRMTTTITLFRYGVLPDLRDNPLTIYISVDFGPDETRWYEVISDIKNMLQGVAGWNQVQVHMENNEGMQSSFD